MRHELAGFQHRLPRWMCGEDLQQYRQISQGFRILPCPLPPSDCPRCSQEMGGWVFRWTWSEVSHDDSACPVFDAEDRSRSEVEYADEDYDDGNNESDGFSYDEDGHPTRVP